MRAVLLLCCVAALLAILTSPTGAVSQQQPAAAAVAPILPSSLHNAASGAEVDAARRQLLEDTKTTQPDVKRTSTVSTTVTPVTVSAAKTQTQTMQQQPAASAAAAGTKPTAKVAAGSSKRSRTLGRKGAPLRQQGGGGNGQVDTNGDPVILPGCSPRDGVYCSDQDFWSFLQTQPAYINLEDAYAYAETNPTAEAGLETKSNIDLAADSFDTATTASAKSGIASKVVTEGLSVETEVANTLTSTKVDGSRLEVLQPDKITVNVDATDITGTYDRRTFNPKYTYVLGQNFGLINGLDTVTDGRK